MSYDHSLQVSSLSLRVLFKILVLMKTLRYAKLHAMSVCDCLKTLQAGYVNVNVYVLFVPNLCSLSYVKTLFFIRPFVGGTSLFKGQVISRSFCVLFFSLYRMPQEGLAKLKYFLEFLSKSSSLSCSTCNYIYVLTDTDTEVIFLERSKRVEHSYIHIYLQTTFMFFILSHASWY